jgi:hypothetical protein
VASKISGIFAKAPKELDDSGGQNVPKMEVVKAASELRFQWFLQGTSRCKSFNPRELHKLPKQPEKNRQNRDGSLQFVIAC